MIFKCLKGCGRTWPRDPVYEIACPVCRAPVGRKCKRPSGRGVWGGFHAARDIAADKAGTYGGCPLGLCGLDHTQDPPAKPKPPAPPPDDLPLFDPDRRRQLDLADAIKDKSR